MLKKKIWVNFQRIIELFTQKIVKKLLKMVLGSGIRDPGSGIRKKTIPDPGSRGQKAPDPGSRIRIRNTAKIAAKLIKCEQSYTFCEVNLKCVFFCF